MTAPARFRKPATGPTDAEMADRDAFDALAAADLATVQAAAEKWRTGLAALVTLAVGGVFAKGAGSFNDIGGDWQRWVVVLLGFFGITAALIGFWYALVATTGNLAIQRRSQIVEQAGSVKAYGVAQAIDALDNLQKAKEWVIAALISLMLGAFIWTTAPKPAPDKPVMQVAPAVGNPYCGKLLSADQQTVVVQVAGESLPRSIAFADVKNMAVKASC